MKKAAAILLVAIFLFNIAGNYVIFSYSQYMVKREMKALIKTGRFHHGKITTFLFAFPITDIHFVRLDKHEFRYKGSMYDIISEKVQDGVVTIRCINDNQEERLLADYSRSYEFLNGHKNATGAKHAAAMQHLVITIALLEESHSKSIQPSFEITYLNFNDSIHSIPSSPPSPPPRNIS